MNKQDHKKDIFNHPRWNEPIGGKVVGHKQITPDEALSSRKDTESILNNMGIKLK